MSTEATLNVDVVANTGKLTGPLQKGETAVKSFAGVVGSLAGVATAALGIVSVFGGIKQAFDDIGEVGKVAKQLGTTTESMSALAYAAKRSGLDLESFEGIAKHLNRTLGEAQAGNAGAIKTFNSLNIDYRKLGAVEFAEQLKAVSDQVIKLPTFAQQSAKSMELFGRSGDAILPFLLKGSAGIQELMDKAQSSGLVIGSETVAQYKEYKKALGELKDVGASAFQQIAIAIAPALGAAGSYIKDFIQGARDKFNEWSPVWSQMRDVAVDAFGIVREIAVQTWDDLIDSGDKVLKFFGVDLAGTFSNFKENIVRGLTVIEVAFENWHLLGQRVILQVQLAFTTFVEDFKAGITKLVQIAAVVSGFNPLKDSFSSLMDHIKAVVAQARPLDPLEQQLPGQIDAINAVLQKQLFEKLKDRLGALDKEKEKAADQAKAVIDVQGKAGDEGKAPGAALKGSVEAANAVAKAQNAVAEAQLQELRKGNNLLMQVQAALAQGAGIFLGNI